MLVTTHFITNNLSMFSLTLLLLLCATCQCLPQAQGRGRNNNNPRGQEDRQNNNRNPITSNRPNNRGQRILEGGFVPSNFGSELRNVRFPGRKLYI